MGLKESIKQFQVRFDNYRNTLLNDKFNKVNEVKNSLIKYLLEMGCPAAFIPFNSFPSSRMPQMPVVPSYITIGHTDISVSKDTKFSSVSVPFLLPLCHNGAFLFEGDLGSMGIPNLFQLIMLRLSLSIPLEFCKFHMVDCDYGRSFAHFNSLQNLKIQKTLYGPDQVHGLFMEMESVMRNMYSGEMGKYSNLSDYNSNNTKSAKPYNFIFIDDFPNSCTSMALDMLKPMITNGNAANAGIYLFINYSTTGSLPHHFDIDFFREHCSVVTSKANGETSLGSLDIFVSQIHSNIVETNIPDTFDKIAELLNVEEEVKDRIPQNEFYNIPENEVWANSSISVSNIPVGISDAGDMVEVSFSQKDAQNAAIVVGKSGFGKSKFLHSLILIAALRYSPDEMEMYLLDFSGVEFNVYAEMHLPHARAIVPEAERELGYYLLREICQEGDRREKLCRENGVDNVEALRKINDQLNIPRILVIIDEFQKLFEYRDDISKQSAKDIEDIIRRFRKYSINIILSSQMAYDATQYLKVDQIGVRIAFSCENRDARLVSMDYLNLNNGCFVYNGKTGDPKYNQTANTFYIEGVSKDNIGGVAKAMNVINCAAEAHSFEPKNAYIFRGDILPQFNPISLIKMEESPKEVRLYFGQSFAIRESDIYVPLVGNSEDNVMIIGGETIVSQEICMFTMMSAISTYKNRENVAFYVFNFLKSDNPLYNYVEACKNIEDHDITFANKTINIVENLKHIYAEVERRGNEDYDGKMKDIYIFIYAMELGQAFRPNRDGRVKPSEAMQLLSNILREGPLVHIHTILQIDNCRSVSQTCGDGFVNYFNYRIVLQMDPKSSRMIGCDASNLYNSQKQWTKYCGYYVDVKNDKQSKFRTYSLIK